MRRVLSAVAAVVLLLALGALAVMALPGAQGAAAPVAVTAAEPEAPAAPDATQMMNMIALPLDASASFAAAGYTFDAKGLAAYIGSPVKKVEQWLPGGQSYQTSTAPFLLNNFTLKTGGVYMVTLDNTDPNLKVFSIVGDVPPPSQTTPQGTPGRVEYTLAGADPCQLNHITVPLDRPDITTASQLAAAIGNVTKVETWDATNQWYTTSTSPFLLNNFATKIGYPYVVCVTSGGNGDVFP